MSIIADIKRRIAYLYQRHVWYIATMHMIFLTYMLCCIVFGVYMTIYCVVCDKSDAVKNKQREEFLISAVWYIFMSVLIANFVASCVPLRTEPETLRKLQEICAHIDENDSIAIGKTQEKQNASYVVIVQPFDV